jgi:hypothetical protein
VTPSIARIRPFAGMFAWTRRRTPCLPCRRSRVRIPSAALKKAYICRPFLRAQSACASASGRTHSGLAAARSSAVPRKTRCLQADSGSSEPKSFCGPAEGRVFCLLRPLARLLLQRHGPADGAIPAVAVLWGQSGFSPETARSTSARSATWRAMARRAVSFLARRRPRQRRGAHHGELVPRQSRGVISEGVAFHRQAGVRAHLGWAPARRPEQARDLRRWRLPLGQAKQAPRPAVSTRGGRRNDAPRSTAAEAKRVSPTSLRGCG